jgi:tRNA-specific 2-thiouridylase
VSGKQESQDLCFLPGGDLRGFLDRELGPGRPGPIVDVTGRELGRHNGLHGLTVGQRRGLGLSAPSPLYVLSVDGGSNSVTVGTENELHRKEMFASGCRLHDLEGRTFRADAQVRSRHEPAPATITPMDGARLHIEFDTPQKALTPGQAVVLYRGDRVLGGGWIQSHALDPALTAHLDCSRTDRMRA